MNNLPEQNDYRKALDAAMDLLKKGTGVNGRAHPCGFKTNSLMLGTGEVVEILDKVWVQRRIHKDNEWKQNMSEEEEKEFYRTEDVLATVYNFYSVDCLYGLDLQYDDTGDRISIQYDDTGDRISIHPSMFKGQVRKA